MTTTTPSRGRRRAPTRMERAAGKAAALQRPRVILALLLLLGLTCVMLLDGYLRAEVGGDERVRDGASAGKVPDKVLNGGPILTFRGGEPVTQTIPKKTIVLTFDDGPNPTYTPTVLKILKKYDVPGTFFLVGSMVSRYPSIVKQMVAQGEEVGIHTFTHVDLSYQSDARIKREMEQTQLRARGRGRDHHHAVPRAVLLGDGRDRQLQLPRLQEARRVRLHQRLRRHRQRRLEAAGCREDRQVGDAVRDVGFLGAVPRRRWCALADHEGAAHVHREDEGEGLHVHHGERRHRQECRSPAGERGRRGCRSGRGHGRGDEHRHGRGRRQAVRGTVRGLLRRTRGQRPGPGRLGRRRRGRAGGRHRERPDFGPPGRPPRGHRHDPLRGQGAHLRRHRRGVGGAGTRGRPHRRRHRRGAASG